MDKIKVSLLGSTGMVGQKMIKLLSKHPYIELVKLSASDSRTGKKYGETVRWIEHGTIPEKFRDMKLVSSSPEDQKDVDYVLSALPPEAAESIELNLVKHGINVISNASPYRLAKDIPLINPEINYEHLRILENKDTKFVKNPNCTSAIMSMPLGSILGLDYERISLVSMQAISGAGYSGLPYMSIDDNIIPYIHGEEEKIPAEISKMYGTVQDNEIKSREIRMSVTSVRVPVKLGHMGVLNVHIDGKVSIEDIINKLNDFNPFKGFTGLYNAPEHPIVIHEEEDRPQNAIDTYNGMEVHVGRISLKDGNLRMVILGNNLVRGAAGITVLTLETMKQLKLI
ncbi:aspartate-semialdehyde dehydrogenase [Ferroplasma sp.]|uniref:aspartate-semialdehyde dehydrogenase n=1 Tax=Ferroplasma sp. TaxID=2591003 RepID=UPI00307E36C0